MKPGLRLDVADGIVHIRKPDGECVGCVERAIFEIVRQLILEEQKADQR